MKLSYLKWKYRCMLQRTNFYFYLQNKLRMTDHVYSAHVFAIHKKKNRGNTILYLEIARTVALAWPSYSNSRVVKIVADKVLNTNACCTERIFIISIYIAASF
jgi:hypothetical protein